MPMYVATRNVYDTFSVHVLVDYCMCNFSVFVLYVCLCLPVYLYFVLVFLPDGE